MAFLPFEGVVELEAFGPLECGVADLNRDGSLDLALSSYMSDSTRSLPLFIYWGTVADSTAMKGEPASRLNPRQVSKPWISIATVTRKLSFITISKMGNHSINSYIYWNSPEGFDKDRRTELPAFGPHFSQMVDPGNL